MDLHEFEALKLEEQEKVFHQSPFKEKGELLLHSHNPSRLAHSLSQEELYLIAKEMDPEEKSELLRYADLDQLMFISDIDCWTKDRIDADGFIGWLETLLAADERRLLSWMNQVNDETLTAGFKKIIQVLKTEREYPSDELLGDRPYFSLDENYFILVNEENLETVKRAIEILYENHRGRYAALLEEVMNDLDDEIEEEAFQRRGQRLAERGFPDFETAYKIYRPITPAEMEIFRRNGASASAVKGEVYPRIPNYPALWSPDRVFFDEILLLLRNDDSGLRESLQEELAWLSNKVIAGEGIDFSSEDRIRHGIERARYFLSLGLESLSSGDLHKARRALQAYWLESIFRCGVTPLLALRDEALKMIREHWPDSQKNFLEFLNPPYDSIFEGLLCPIPECYDPEAKSLPARRDFRSLKDLEMARLSLRQIARTFGFLKDHFPVLLRRLLVEKTREGPGPSRASLFGVLGTLFSRFVLKQELIASALSQADLARFVRAAFEEKAGRKYFHPWLKEDFLKRHFSEEDSVLLRPFWGFVFEGLEEELGNLETGKGVDSRYISAVAVSKVKDSVKTPAKARNRKKRG